MKPTEIYEKNVVGKQTHHAFFSKKNDASVWSIIFCWGRFSQKLRFLKGSVANFVALPAEPKKIFSAWLSGKTQQGKPEVKARMMGCIL